MSDYNDAVYAEPPIGPYDLEQESDNVSHKEEYEDYIRKPSDYENEIAKVYFYLCGESLDNFYAKTVIYT